MGCSAGRSSCQARGVSRGDPLTDVNGRPRDASHVGLPGGSRAGSRSAPEACRRRAGRPPPGGGLLHVQPGRLHRALAGGRDPGLADLSSTWAAGARRRPRGRTRHRPVVCIPARTGLGSISQPPPGQVPRSRATSCGSPPGKPPPGCPRRTPRRAGLPRIPPAVGGVRGSRAERSTQRVAPPVRRARRGGGPDRAAVRRGRRRTGSRDDEAGSRRASSPPSCPWWSRHASTTRSCSTRSPSRHSCWPERALRSPGCRNRVTLIRTASPILPVTQTPAENAGSVAPASAHARLAPGILALALAWAAIGGFRAPVRRVVDRRRHRVSPRRRLHDAGRQLAGRGTVRRPAHILRRPVPADPRSHRRGPGRHLRHGRQHRLVGHRGPLGDPVLGGLAPACARPATGFVPPCLPCSRRPRRRSRIAWCSG